MKRQICYLLFAFIFCSTSLNAQSELEYLNIEFTRAKANNDYFGLLTIIDKILEINPEESTVINDKGVVYGLLGDTVSAIKYFDLSIKLNPMEPNNYWNRGIILHSKKNYHAALSDFNSGIDLGLNGPFNLIFRGNVHSILHNFDDALKDYDNAISINPLYDTAYVMKAKAIIYEKDDISWAKKVLNECLNKNPKSILARAYLTELLIYEKAYKEIITQVNLLLIYSSENHKFYYYCRGMAKFKLGDSEGACEDMHISQKGGMLEALEFLNENCASVNSTPEFRAEYLAIEADRLSERRLYSLAIIKFSEAIQLSPTNSDYYFHRGRAYFNKLDYELAITDFKRALALKPKDPWTLFMLGQCEMQLADFEEIPDFNPALKYMEEACKRKNELTFYQSTAALCMDMKNYSLAEKYLLNAIELFPTASVLYVMIGENYIFLNAVEKACDYLNKSQILGNPLAGELINNNCN